MRTFAILQTHEARKIYCRLPLLNFFPFLENQRTKLISLTEQAKNIFGMI